MAIYGNDVYGGDTYSGLVGLNAFEYELSSFEGRIKPENAGPASGDYLFCLGSDRVAEQLHDLAVGDHADLEQSIDLTGVNFVKATWRVRQPSIVPLAMAITSPRVMVGDVLNFWDPTKPLGDTLLAVISNTVDAFTNLDLHRIIRVAGATNPGNNGDKRVTGTLSPQIAIVDAGIVADENPLGGGTGTASLVGARWRASITVAGVERAFVVEYPGRDVIRVDLQAHVSKLAGVQPVRFRLELQEAA